MWVKVFFFRERNKIPRSFVARSLACAMGPLATIQRSLLRSPAVGILLHALSFFALSINAYAQDWSWQGDLRLRTQLEKNGDQESRVSERIRARLGIQAKVNETIKAEVRLASSTDTRNQDQVLGESAAAGSRRRSFGLDLAYAAWEPETFFTLYGGRFSQIHYRPGESQVLLDDEISLEGMGVTAHYAWNAEMKAWINAGSVYIRENYDSFLSVDETDNMLNWAQTRIEFSTEKFFSTIGFGFYNFVGVEGKNFSDLTTGGTAAGNSESIAGVVKSPFLPKQYFVEFKYKPGQAEYGAFSEFILNRETRDPNKASQVGLSGSYKDWQAQLAYASVNSDAVLALFTDAHFAAGQTDAKGMIGSLAWAFDKNMSVRLTHSRAKTDVSGANKKYLFTHLDVIAHF